MDKETLDRLMIDRAVGALDADVETLLDTYLEQAGVSAEQYSSTCEVIRLSKDLLKTEGESVLPAFRGPKSVRNRQRQFVILQTTGIAAMLLIGFFIGRGRVADNEPVLKCPVVVSVASAPSDSDSGIWSINRFRKLSTSHRRSTWKWTSPVRQPEPVNPGELL